MVLFQTRLQRRIDVSFHNIIITTYAQYIYTLSQLAKNRFLGGHKRYGGAEVHHVESDCSKLGVIVIKQ